MLLQTYLRSIWPYRMYVYVYTVPLFSAHLACSLRNTVQFNGRYLAFNCTVKCIKMFQVAKKVFEGAVLCVQTSLSYISFSFSLSCGKWLGQKFTRSLQKKPNRCTCKKRKLICNCYSFVYVFLVLTFVGFLGLSVHLVVLKWINRLFTKLRSQTTLYPHIPLERTNKQTKLNLYG